MLKKLLTCSTLILSIYFLRIHPVGAKTDFELQFENFSCKSSEVSENPIERYNCGLNKNVKRRTLHMEFSMREELKEFDFHIGIIMPRRPVDFVLLNLTVDGCHLLSNKNQVPLMRLSREILDRYSNFPRQCPFQRGKTYYIRAFRLDLSLIPAMNMETPVRLKFAYMRRQLPMLQGKIVARVQRTTIAKRKD
ncbi:uncharacterized protein LOC132793389 [Drosophila nasuta]|uniref:uncharacterized protein LOC132793389 n=1 Tax=Drosophila nasuta TaxID=42062 RepID=UPI00295E72E2|nr:uncharacterized protein LOC132793389 [Drosophila nasuta]